MADAQRAILVVDDDAPQRELLAGVVQSLGFRPVLAGSAEDGLAVIRDAPPAMVLLDVRLPGITGIEALAEIRAHFHELPVLLITAYADVREAVAAMKGGADDYLTKPVDLDELKTAITDAVGVAHGDRVTGEAPHPELPDWFVVESPAMRNLVQNVAVVAPSDAPVLITGENGTGKDVIAQLIHAWSPRQEEPLVAANCAGLPESLIESELFGHTRGSFTGATQPRQGLFRAADGGTLFLDEIGELPLHLQPKLLRALESGSITPVGSDTPVEVDTRLVAATNRDLDEAVRHRQFREDLYYRINVVELHVPPLRERREDIPALAKHFAEEFHGGPVRLSAESMQCLLAHSWSGNVRELRNAVQRACLVCGGDVLMPEHLPPKLAGLAAGASFGPKDQDRLSQVERATILATLAETRGNRTQAAHKLGISRRTLLNKLKEMELPPGL